MIFAGDSPPQKSVMTEVITTNDFNSIWNNVEMTFDDDVIIHMHGNRAGINAKDSGNFSIYIPELKEQTINSIMLDTCYGGNLNYMNKGQKRNAACQFMDRMNVNYVIAPDNKSNINFNRDEDDYLKIEDYLPKSSVPDDLVGDPKLYSPNSSGYLLYYGDKKDNNNYRVEYLGNGPYDVETLRNIGQSRYEEVKKWKN